MKKRNFLFVLLVASIAFTSCKKDEPGGDPLDYPYSPLSDEANKANLEEDGIAMINELEEMKSADAIEVAISFNNMMSEEENMASINKNILLTNLLASLKTSTSKDAIVKSLKSAMEEEPVSIMELWNEKAAKYTWNFIDQEWDSTGLSNAIVFEFPGKEGDKTNTATLTIDNFNTQVFTEIDYDLEEEIEPELPTSLNVELAYNGTVLSTFTYSAAFTSKGVPTSIELILTVDAFSLSAKATHSPYTAAGLTYSFKHSNKILIEMHADASGNWSDENIDANTTEYEEFMYVDGWSGDSIFDYYTEVVIENIVTNGNAYIQAMNTKIAGMVDMKAMAPILEDLENKRYEEQITEEEYYTQLAEAYNKYAKFVVVYADNNQKIAAAEFYSYLSTDDWGYEDYRMDVRFIFADGSKVDAETYFNEGFSDLIDEMNAFIEDINAEYEIEIDPIEN